MAEVLSHSLVMTSPLSHSPDDWLLGWKDVGCQTRSLRQIGAFPLH